MIKATLAILGIIIVGLSVVMLRNGNYPTSGLMLLSVGIIMLLVSVVLRGKKINKDRKNQNS